MMSRTESVPLRTCQPVQAKVRVKALFVLALLCAFSLAACDSQMRLPWNAEKETIVHGVLRLSKSKTFEEDCFGSDPADWRLKCPDILERPDVGTFFETLGLAAKKVRRFQDHAREIELAVSLHMTGQADALKYRPGSTGGAMRSEFEALSKKYSFVETTGLSLNRMLACTRGLVLRDAFDPYIRAVGAKISQLHNSSLNVGVFCRESEKVGGAYRGAQVQGTLRIVVPQADASILSAALVEQGLQIKVSSGR